jgi:hypothetical protein
MRMAMPGAIRVHMLVRGRDFSGRRGLPEPAEFPDRH